MAIPEQGDYCKRLVRAGGEEFNKRGYKIQKIEHLSDRVVFHYDDANSRRRQLAVPIDQKSFDFTLGFLSAVKDVVRNSVS